MALLHSAHYQNRYEFWQANNWLRVKVLTSSHRIFQKNFETELLVDNSKLPLNHFMQETLANMMLGIMKSLKELEEPPRTIELKIKKLAKPTNVDAHKYP